MLGARDTYEKTRSDMAMKRMLQTTWCVLALCGFLIIPALVHATESSSSKPKATPRPQFTKPPKGAIVLFDGKDASQWVGRNGRAVPWRVADGAMMCLPLTGNIRTKQTFGDCKLHVEFKVPSMRWWTGQGRGNSGVFLQGLYEVQILDSYGIDRPKKNDCAALYNQIAPSTNACLPPLKWQSYDITFRAPRRDKDTGKLTKGRITVVHNGVTVIDDVEIPKIRRPRQAGTPGPIVLQDHVCPVGFRNIWLMPLD